MLRVDNGRRKLFFDGTGMTLILRVGTDFKWLFFFELNAALKIFSISNKLKSLKRFF